MDKILIVNKEKGMTSRDVINFLVKKFNTKKIGHTGTLDPIATGVMVVLIGKYTKLVELITNYDKVYEAEVKLGVLTDTLDITGNIIKTEKVNVTTNEVKNALKKMIGSYNQEVPIYSAVKIHGKKLYEYARNNEKVELPVRKVNIKSLELIDDIRKENNFVFLKIRTHVSKGTYIRALINDIALSLGTIGTMTSLTRIKQGNIELNDAYTIENIKNDKYDFYDFDRCFNNITKIEIDDSLYFKIKNGVQIKNIYNEEIVLFKYKERNVAIYKNENNILKCWKYLL